MVSWLLFVAPVVHVLEEYVYPGGFPELMKTAAPRFKPFITTRFAVLINGAFLGLGLAAAIYGPATPRFTLSVAGVLGINALHHLGIAVRFRRYVPGSASSLILYLPTAVYFYYSFLITGLVGPGEAVACSAVGLGLNAVPLLYLFMAWYHHGVIRAARDDQPGNLEQSRNGVNSLEKCTRLLIPGNYAQTLETAMAAAWEAGQQLLNEFHRPGGPRGSSGHCPCDTQAEILIRERLRAAFPDYGLRGEECPDQDRDSRDPQSHVWVIDPNDGTSPFQKGWRGASVSIALLRSGVPILGVVYAYAAQAGQGDLIAWAEGQPFIRNGRTLKERPKENISAESTVFLSQGADHSYQANAELCLPARYRIMPSVAYRLALVAAGEGVAAVSVNQPVDWDMAAGHALLRSMGLELYRMGGRPVTYDRAGRGQAGNVVGGDPEFARDLSRRDWDLVFTDSREPAQPYGLIKPAGDKIVSDPQLLNRAQGCLAGQLAGDNVGGLVEFQSASRIAVLYPEGIKELADGGFWNILAGQPTDDSELALMLARSIVNARKYEPEEATRAYVWWLESRPFDIGTTTSNALLAAQIARKAGTNAGEAAAQAALSKASSQANGALMRVSPLAIYGHKLPEQELAHLARTDAALTHAHPICQDANAVFCIAIGQALKAPLTAQEVYDRTVQWAETAHIQAQVMSVLKKARIAPPDDYQTHMGWVLIALHNAFYQLLHAPSPQEGIVRTVMAGGDTDTNAAIAGALLGAVHGLAAFPHQWIDRLLTCRPITTYPASGHLRPKCFWPVDFLILAERLAWMGMNLAPGVEKP